MMFFILLWVVLLALMLWRRIRPDVNRVEIMAQLDLTLKMPGVLSGMNMLGLGFPKRCHATNPAGPPFRACWETGQLGVASDHCPAYR